MDDTNDICACILKQLPEPEVYAMPDDYLHREMLALHPRVIIRDRFTWLAKLNVLIYRWITITKPFLKGEKSDPPDPLLSEVLRPSRNQYIAALPALAETIGKFRPGEVPIEEGKDMITSTRGVFAALHEIVPGAMLACEEAFNAFVRTWNYKSSSRLPQKSFIADVATKADRYLQTLTPVFLAVSEIEDHILGKAKSVQLTLTAIDSHAENVFMGIDTVQRQLAGATSKLSDQIEKTEESLENKTKAISREISSVNKTVKKAQDTLRKKIDSAKQDIITVLPVDCTGEEVKEAMAKRAIELQRKRADISMRSACSIVCKEYDGIPGAYKSPEALRKRLSR